MKEPLKFTSRSDADDVARAMVYASRAEEVLLWQARCSELISIISQLRNELRPIRRPIARERAPSMSARRSA